MSVDNGENSKILRLSRHFDENVLLVTNVCSKCYSELYEVRIVAVNRKFLNNTQRFSRIKNKCTEVKYKNLKSVDKSQISKNPSETWSDDNAAGNVGDKLVPWSPPRSPHNLIEESLYRNPWSLLVATIFLNKTSCMTARPVLEQFLQEYPNPESVIKKEPGELEPYFESIGLRKRAEQVWNLFI